MNVAGIFSRCTDEWTTPSEVQEYLYAEFDLNLDPCPLGASDGLLQGWNGRAFVNPPYSKIFSFIEKALLEIAAGRCEIAVFLLPSRTGTAWFHELVLPNAREIRFIRGRLRFGGSKINAPFDSVVVVFQ